jgi:hypothetical protein
VYGTVRDAKSHQPLAGAIVYVGYRPDRRTVTNSAGKYSIAFPAQRSFPVEVKRTGYVGYLAAGTLRPHGSYRLDVSLQRAGGTPEVPPPPIFFKG